MYILRSAWTTRYISHYDLLTLIVKARVSGKLLSDSPLMDTICRAAMPGGRCNLRSGCTNYKDSPGKYGTQARP